MRTSRQTVLRDLRHAGCPRPTTAPVVIGIDDWAMTRGHRYGTIIVDLERRCPIELMDGRDTTAVEPWLSMQPTIEVIARDRAGAYADAARTAAPDAQQVADRWHLMVNLCEAVERLLLRHARQMREAARQVSQALWPIAAPGSPIDTDGVALKAPRRRSWQRLGDERRVARLARATRRRCAAVSRARRSRRSLAP
jgi:transposase